MGFAGFLKSLTAVTIKLGPFIDGTDGSALEDLLSISDAEVRLSKNGADFSPKDDLEDPIYDESGMYTCELGITDTNTVGRLEVVVAESDARPVSQTYMVMPANVYDSLFGTDKLEVDATLIEGSDATDKINAEVVDVLTVDTQTQPDKVDVPADTSIATMIAFLYKAWRNRSTQSSDTYTLYNDDGTTADQTASVDDTGSLFDRGEMEEYVP